MKLEINITKGKFWVLVCLGIFLVGIMVYAVANDKPNPGHSLDEIDLTGLTAGDVGAGEFPGNSYTFQGDLAVGGKIQGTLDIRTRENKCTGVDCTATCEPGETAISGGCWCRGKKLRISHKSGEGWKCTCDGEEEDKHTAWVYCLRAG